ncbi:hypothetical protein BDZ89DRAFT_1147703 [Hymenopellis radicata]|nr:hypothetical protein BDZ89DRAFT_1147703 [Hymenopellis radicata]
MISSLTRLGLKSVNHDQSWSLTTTINTQRRYIYGSLYCPGPCSNTPTHSSRATELESEIYRLLLIPLHSSAVSDDEQDVPTIAPPQQQVISTRISVPPYGRRSTWKPWRSEDYGNGGSYPECHVAHYPLEMGRKKASAGNTLALQVDSEGSMTRTTRAGIIFSPFTLGAPFVCDVDAEDLLRARFAELDAMEDVDVEEAVEELESEAEDVPQIAYRVRVFLA